MCNHEQEINRVWDIAVYLQMMAAFCDEIDFDNYTKLMLALNDHIKSSEEDEIKSLLPFFENKLSDIANPIKQMYPLKRNYREIASDWNEQFRIDKEFFEKGVMVGWLEQQIDLSKHYRYDYYPYHFKLGMGIHKGRGEIEENFLLQDAFTCLVKAERYLKLLDNFGNIQKQKIKAESKNKFDKDTLDSLTTIKYEVSFYSRLTIISFYSFLECFVNSIGFDHYFRNRGILNQDDAEELQGTKNGRYLNLRYKIEKFQKIIREDRTAKIILSDNNQVIEPFKSLFANYEELRNSAVHFSPAKTRIWLKPHDWLKNAQEFARLVIEASMEIWKTCHETNKGPDYLGRLEFNRLYKIAQSRETIINKIKESIIV